MNYMYLEKIPNYVKQGKKPAEIYTLKNGTHSIATVIKALKACATMLYFIS